MKNVDVLNIISDFLNFEDFMYNFSITSKDFNLEKRNLLFRIFPFYGIIHSLFLIYFFYKGATWLINSL